MKLITNSSAGCLFACAIALAMPIASDAAETVTYTFVSDTLKNPGSQVVRAQRRRPVHREVQLQEQRPRTRLGRTLPARR